MSLVQAGRSVRIAGLTAATARLTFGRCGDRTILESGYATSPVKLIATRGVSHTCWMFVATLGGGIVGGDQIDLTIDARASTTALIATQASTKIYKSLRPCGQRVRATVSDGALLAVVPDPVVCFADADFSQEQRYDVGEGADLLVLDWFTSGRHAVGERWAFRRYASRIDVRRENRWIVRDAVVLQKSDGDIGRRLGRFNACLTAILSGPRLSVHTDRIVTASNAAGIEKHAETVVAAWPLRDGGVMIRMVGMSVEDVSDAIRRRLNFLADLVGDDPWIRKW